MEGGREGRSVFTLSKPSISCTEKKNLPLKTIGTFRHVVPLLYIPPSIHSHIPFSSPLFHSHIFPINTIFFSLFLSLLFSAHFSRTSLKSYCTLFVLPAFFPPTLASHLPSCEVFLLCWTARKKKWKRQRQILLPFLPLPFLRLSEPYTAGERNMIVISPSLSFSFFLSFSLYLIYSFVHPHEINYSCVCVCVCLCVCVCVCVCLCLCLCLCSGESVWVYGSPLIPNSHS